MSDAQAKVYLLVRFAEILEEPVSYDEIAEALHCAKSTVSKRVGELVLAGVLVKKRGARGLRVAKRRAAA